MDTVAHGEIITFNDLPCMIATIFQISGKRAANLLRVGGPFSATAALSRKTKPLVRAYALWWLLSLLAFTAVISMMTTHRPVARLIGYPLYDVSMEDKLAYYRQHKSEFDLILLGDSLTYTGLHPEFIDPELGTHSINMAHFAHWLATQYPLIQDLIPDIPRGTRVLWSVHLYDFNDDGLSVQHVYSVGIVNALRYWSWGAPNPGLLDNVLYYNPLTSFFMKTGELRARVIEHGAKSLALAGMGASALQTSARTLGAASNRQPDANPTDIVKAGFPTVPEFVSLQKPVLSDTVQFKTRLTEYYSHFPGVAGVSPVSDHGQINSVILYLSRGGYYRIELVPAYFREKQRDMARAYWHLDDKAAQKFNPPPLGPVSLKMFEAGLAAFHEAGIPVTVNVMEEAPFTFPNEIVRKKYRRLVDETLQPIVRSFRDDYVHADYSSIMDSDYFDYNHFNSNGIGKYTPLLVRALHSTHAFTRGSAD